MAKCSSSLDECHSYLAENNMFFQESSDKLFTPQNGKFLGLIQMFAKFDPVMQKHLAFAIKGGRFRSSSGPDPKVAGSIKGSDHYCEKINGVQKRILNLNPLALYVPCVRHSLNLKLCDTWWKAKISSVKAICFQVGDIDDALIALSEIEGCDPKTAHEAITLEEHLKDFSFLVSLTVCCNHKSKEFGRSEVQVEPVLNYLKEKYK
ncbi:uncharacterized protein LOC124814467 [Hydra vulgaris]|uniref:uncharacterized protein LOC124814467 n=1 Tax=Hydra vulgaris TaxID=6087 RepID=UPI001F5FF2BA|nr:uncharacterized protein LOC124814467 [Hydra vulgaris]